MAKKYSIQGNIISKRNGLPVPHATIEVFDVDKTTYATKKQNTVNAESNPDGTFNLSFDYTKPTRPNIIFRITQDNKYIYSEHPAEDTRWGIGDVFYVNIGIDEDCYTSNPNSTPRPLGIAFIFTRVGIIAKQNINKSDGYADYATDPTLAASQDSDIPFGLTLDIGGWFGEECEGKVEYYRIYYGHNIYIKDPLINSWYGIDAKDIKPGWHDEVMGPQKIGNVDYLYKIPEAGKPWNFPDLVIRWDTTKVSNGKYALRIEGYDKNAKQVFKSDVDEGQLTLQTDNTPPICHINKVWHDYTDEKGQNRHDEIQVCDIVSFDEPAKNPNDDTHKLIVEFEASDNLENLRQYWLNALFGHNQTLHPPTKAQDNSPSDAVDDYSKHKSSTKKWNGGTYTVEYQKPRYSEVEMRSCAYQLRLRVDKRTQNGYGLAYWDYEDTYHITIKRGTSSI